MDGGKRKPHFGLQRLNSAVCLGMGLGSKDGTNGCDLQMGCAALFYFQVAFVSFSRYRKGVS
jgi:hypothetical protein